VRAGVQYVFAVALRTQRWAPPAILLVGLIAWVWSTPPVTLDTVKVVAIVEFALACWLGYTTVTSEEPGQEAITISCLGSIGRLVVARWIAAFTMAACFPLIMLLGNYALHVFKPEPALAAGLLLIATAACAAAVGALVGSLLPTRPGWAAGLLIIATLTQAVPYVAPVGLANGALAQTGLVAWPQLVAASGLGAVITIAALKAVVLLRRNGPAANRFGTGDLAGSRTDQP